MSNKLPRDKEVSTIKSLEEQNRFYRDLFPSSQADLSNYKIPKKAPEVYVYKRCSTLPTDSCERKSILVPHFQPPRLEYGKPKCWPYQDTSHNASSGSGQSHGDDDDDDAVDQSGAPFLAPTSVPQGISEGTRLKKRHKPRFKLNSDRDHEFSDIETLATATTTLVTSPARSLSPSYYKDEKEDTGIGPTLVCSNSSSNTGEAVFVPPRSVKADDDNGIPKNGLINGHTKMLVALNGHFQVVNNPVVGSTEIWTNKDSVDGKHVLPNGTGHHFPSSQGNDGACSKGSDDDDEDDDDILMIGISEMERKEINMGFQVNGLRR